MQLLTVGELWGHILSNIMNVNKRQKNSFNQIR